MQHEIGSEKQSHVGTCNEKSSAITKHHTEDCEICFDFLKHKSKFDEARLEYQKARNFTSGESVCTAECKELFYCQSSQRTMYLLAALVTFNETFASLTPNDPDYTVLLHEALSGQNASDVASAFIRVIQLTDSNTIIFWLLWPE